MVVQLCNKSQVLKLKKAKNTHKIGRTVTEMKHHLKFTKTTRCQIKVYDICDSKHLSNFFIKIIFHLLIRTSFGTLMRCNSVLILVQQGYIYIYIYRERERETWQMQVPQSLTILYQIDFMQPISIILAYVNTRGSILTYCNLTLAYVN